MRAPAIFVMITLLMLATLPGFSQEDVTIVAPASEAAEELDLKAVSELFKESKDLEAFEKALNDPNVGVNNLDLDENGEVDFIRIVEASEGDTRVIILQVPLGEDDFQDVATIEVERSDDEAYNMQIHGNEDLYGENYYVQPTVVHVHTWPVIVWLYRPAYRPYRSIYYYGYYPRWWRPYPHVHVNVYHTRTVKYTRTTTFRVSRTTRVHSVTRVKYKPRSSTRVRKTTTKTTIRKKDGKRKKVKRSRTTRRRR